MRRKWVKALAGLATMMLLAGVIWAEVNVTRDTVTITIASGETASTLNDASSITREGIIRHVVLTLPDCTGATSTLTLVNGTTTIYTYGTPIAENTTTTVDLNRYVAGKTYIKLTSAGAEAADRTITGIVYTEQ